MLHLSYLLYLGISIAMTVWVARTLSKNGEVFLVKCFGQDEVLAKSTNHLLVVGFYLINIGFIALRLDGWDAQKAVVSMIPYVGSKIGLSVLVLGAMHFFNMAMISRYGRTVASWASDNRIAQEPRGIPPIPPSMR
ncbi:hypothetical protein [Pseudoxanthomonas wuyuanensis]|uniref:Uncharacterized protein n=1 Tax=Pseudoxanthomonas wuyuanensis TaxID=1073196 RepID=A0A286DDU2_9GAMM|nr:hypothetical protein [Pseudoxanthomonas wuyuanensis]SOD56836.1 hypothetical protein SAMN06296416_11133 [Pseudoxanthomonas wuyuanensis]